MGKGLGEHESFCSFLLEVQRVTTAEWTSGDTKGVLLLRRGIITEQGHKGGNITERWHKGGINTQWVDRGQYGGLVSPSSAAHSGILQKFQIIGCQT